MTELMSKQKDIVIFHYPCQDGTASAWVVYKWHNDFVLPQPEFIPAEPSTFDETLYEKVVGKNVLMVDIAYSKEIIEKLYAKCKSLVILDHHKTNKDELKDMSYATFNMEKSGVGLAWEHFYPNFEMPLFLQMIQERDLWKWVIPDSRDFCEGMFFYRACCNGYLEQFREQYDVLFKSGNLKKYIEIGKVLRTQKEKTIGSILRFNSKVYTYRFRDSDYKVCIHNTDSKELISDLGNAFCSSGRCDFCVLWRYDQDSESFFCSLRSNNKVDVSEICKIYGGGGHPNASGCTLKNRPDDKPILLPFTVFCT